ncbi:MAG: RNA polymerase sigma factor [Verrucomicrobiales bacterium]|nr:RNA polymerase sigma factor [Verrucomicrobiales bacterium]
MEPTSQPEPAASEELLPTRPSLLARLRNPDDSRVWHRGWEEFYALYHPVIYRHAVRSGLPDQDAEEVVQEIVIGVARNIPQFQYDPGKSSFKTWLFRVARNKIVDHLRKRARHARGPVVSVPAVDDEKGVEALAEVADDKMLAPDQEWELAWETNLRRAALDHVGRRVKPMTMRLYLYHIVEGHDVAETVAHFRHSQVPPDTVHLAKHRVQKMVDEALALLREGKTLP